MRSIRFFVRFVIRFVILWAADALSLLFAAWLLPGVNLSPNAAGSVLASAAAAAFMLGIVNLLIRPVILLLALPLGALVTLVIGFFVNAIALLITARLLPVLQALSWRWSTRS
jgi:putative membrane protein